MKVCIYGAGAIGAHIGVLMKLAGVDVSLIARGAHLEAIRQNGLKLIIGGEEKVARMPATNDPAELGPQDFLVIALKSHQAWEAAEQMKPLLGPHTAVVTAQNGIPWWYFYGFDGQYANLQLESVDPRGRQWNALDRSARSAARSIPPPRSSPRASSSTRTATATGSASRPAARPSALRSSPRHSRRPASSRRSIRRSATTSG